jgi:hypothetical protein
VVTPGSSVSVSVPKLLSTKEAHSLSLFTKLEVSVELLDSDPTPTVMELSPALEPPIRKFGTGGLSVYDKQKFFLMHRNHNKRKFKPNENNLRLPAFVYIQ